MMESSYWLFTLMFENEVQSSIVCDKNERNSSGFPHCDALANGSFPVCFDVPVDDYCSWLHQHWCTRVCRTFIFSCNNPNICLIISALLGFGPLHTNVFLQTFSSKQSLYPSIPFIRIVANSTVEEQLTTNTSGVCFEFLLRLTGQLNVYLLVYNEKMKLIVAIVGMIEITVLIMLHSTDNVLQYQLAFDDGC